MNTRTQHLIRCLLFVALSNRSKKVSLTLFGQTIHIPKTEEGSSDDYIHHFLMFPHKRVTTMS